MKSFALALLAIFLVCSQSEAQGRNKSEAIGTLESLDEKCDAGNSDTCMQLSNYLISNKMFVDAVVYAYKACLLGSKTGCDIQKRALHSAKKDKHGNGAAEHSDLIGYWKTVDEILAPGSPLESSPWPQKYQYFAFYRDGTMVSVMMSSYTKVRKTDLDYARKTFGKQNNSFEWINKFVLVTNPNVSNYKELWGVHIINDANAFAAGKIKDTEYKDGDLVMSLANPKNGNAIYYRHIRRLH